MFDEPELTPELLIQLTDGEMDESDTDLMVSSVHDINLLQDEELWFIIGASADIVELFGCPSENGLMRLAYFTRTFAVTTPELIIHAKICNPKDLPYKLDNASQSIVLIFADHTIKKFFSMDRLCMYIEDTIKRYDQCDISDFAILIGNEKELDEIDWNELVLKGIDNYAVR